MEHKKYTSKDENRPSQPKNGIWGIIPVWSCDISIFREFYMENEEIYFWESERRKFAPLKPKNGAQKIQHKFLL
jgi:hypothetical protein